MNDLLQRLDRPGHIGRAKVYLVIRVHDVRKEVQSATCSQHTLPPPHEVLRSLYAYLSTYSFLRPLPKLKVDCGRDRLKLCSLHLPCAKSHLSPDVRQLTQQAGDNRAQYLGTHHFTCSTVLTIHPRQPCHPVAPPRDAPSTPPQLAYQVSTRRSFPPALQYSQRQPGTAERYGRTSSSPEC